MNTNALKKCVKFIHAKAFNLTHNTCAWSSEQSTKVYSVDYPNQADLKIYVVKYKNQADEKIFFVDDINKAGLKDFFHKVSKSNGLEE